MPVLVCLKSRNSSSLAEADAVPSPYVFATHDRIWRHWISRPHIVRHLLDADLAVRIASRHPDRANSLFSGDVSGVESAHADVNDDGSIARAVAGAWAVVNAVSLYAERGKCTFRSVHVDAAKRVAMLARQAGAEILVHISGIGAGARSASPYIRSRGEGEAAVLDSFRSAKVVRPAVMFGPLATAP